VRKKSCERIIIIIIFSSEFVGEGWARGRERSLPARSRAEGAFVLCTVKMPATRKGKV